MIISRPIRAAAAIGDLISDSSILAGQRMATRDVLPRNVRGAHSWQLEAIGFEFGGDLDEILVRANLPRGWSKRPTDHPLNTDLIDEKGRLRGQIFYKDAIYDRRAELAMVRRFDINSYHRASEDQQLHVVVTDAGKVVRDFGSYAHTGGDLGGDALRLQLTTEAKGWLRRRRPRWHDPMQHWDEGDLA